MFELIFLRPKGLGCCFIVVESEECSGESWVRWRVAGRVERSADGYGIEAFRVGFEALTGAIAGSENTGLD
nr:hypothetical protein [Tanacetum cinerariifolium]